MLVYCFDYILYKRDEKQRWYQHSVHFAFGSKFIVKLWSGGLFQCQVISKKCNFATKQNFGPIAVIQLIAEKLA